MTNKKKKCGKSKAAPTPLNPYTTTLNIHQSKSYNIMNKIPLKTIREIIEDRYTAPEVDYFSKKALVIEDYEALDTVRTVDSAFPITWADLIRKKFGKIGRASCRERVKRGVSGTTSHTQCR